jgi:murein DD-endopeptidase MepM/ murein hydrolase activator NlpD
VIAKLNEYQRKLEAKRVDISKNKAQLNSSIAQLRQTQAGRKVLLLQAVQAQQAASAQATTLFQGIVKERQRLAEIRRQRAEEARRRRLAEEKRRREEAARIAAIRDAQERERQKQFEAQRQTQANADIEAIRPIPLPASIGRLLFPISGGRITADFGEEGDWMTISAPQAGAPVLASADGQVMGVRLLAANYGYTILIAHTENLDVITTYGNLQAPLVQFGQGIKAGQVIGYTGGGTLIPPNDLHFGVARGGVTVNPRGYF